MFDLLLDQGQADLTKVTHIVSMEELSIEFH